MNLSRSWTRVDGIDLLRGLAIFFVLMNHIHIRLLGADVPYTHFLPRQLVHVLVWNGQLGVQIFFVVSGFLITSISLRRWGSLSELKVREFYVLRFARIAPLLVALLVILSVLHGARIEHYVVPEKTGGLGRALLAALTFHVNVLEAHRGYLPANWDILWSLSVEEMFYLFFPLVSRLLGKGVLFFVVLATFVAIGPFGRTVFAQGNEIWQEYSYLGGMEGIAIGCLTSLIAPRLRWTRPFLWASGAIGMLTVGLSLALSWQGYTGWLGRTGLNMTVLGLGTALLIAASSERRWRSPGVLAPLLKIGQYSYEVYLTHMFVVFLLFDAFVALGKPMRLVPLLFLATIGLAAGLGFLTAHFYSEPMNRILRNRWGDGPNRLGAALASQD